MSTDLQASLGRLKIGKKLGPLKKRPPSDLPFWTETTPLRDKVLLDTTVYVDILQRRFPASADVFLRAADAYHSTVTEAEMVTLCSSHDPEHPGTPAIIRQIATLFEMRPPHRTVNPDRDDWVNAGLLSGLLVRVQSFTREDRAKLLNDALILQSARKHGLTVLTRNLKDFDLLQQLEPSAQVLFYERA